MWRGGPKMNWNWVEWSIVIALALVVFLPWLWNRQCPVCRGRGDVSELGKESLGHWLSHRPCPRHCREGRVGIKNRYRNILPKKRR